MKNVFLALNAAWGASAGLMIDGKIQFAALEERFTRRKFDVGYPKNSIDWCIKQAKISPKDIDKVAFTTINEDPFRVKSKLHISFDLKDHRNLYEEGFYAKKIRGESTYDLYKWLRDGKKFKKEDAGYDFAFLTDEMLKKPEKAVSAFREEKIKTVCSHLKINKEKIVFIDHHTAHAYYASFLSHFNDKEHVVLTLDGWGDGKNQTVWKVKNKKLKLIAESSENDIGRVFKFATLFLGMTPGEHEHKVMGMAPYAKESHMLQCYEKFKDISKVENMKIINKNRPQDLWSFLRDIWTYERFDNISAAVQFFAEELACNLVKDIYKKIKIPRLALSGGVVMNVKVNKKISEIENIKEVFVPPSPGDESLSLGGLYYLNNKYGNNKTLTNVYLGYDIDENSILNYPWKNLKKKFKIKSDIKLEDIVKLLIKGDVVARAYGPAEFGQRALGNRSILANPSIPGMIKKINEVIKKRDFWMPFALSILQEKSKKFIKNPKNISSSFMTIAFDTFEKNVDKIKAGTHPYDGTVRPQFVNKDDQGTYYDLIKMFYKKTKIPALLNTSFNIHGEPIVNTIGDALKTFKNSGINHLWIGRILLSKKK